MASAIRIASVAGVFVLVVTIMIFSFAPKGTELPVLPPLRSDKVNHFAGNYALVLCLLTAFPRLRPSVGAGLIILLGGCLEYIQQQVGREASLGDFAANVAGVLFAVLPIWMFRLRTRGPR